VLDGGKGCPSASIRLLASIKAGIEYIVALDNSELSQIAAAIGDTERVLRYGLGRYSLSLLPDSSTDSAVGG
jgi:hypothetical protein